MAKYDDVDYHEDQVVRGGQVEDAGWHIACYLAWMIRNGLMQRDALEREAEDPRLVSSVPAMELLLAVFDGKLTDDFMTDEGLRFSDACYEAYIDAIDAAITAADPDGYVDGATPYDLAAGVLDPLYAAWSRSPDTWRAPDDPEDGLGWEPDEEFTPCRC